jgi:hypothetical protein
VIPDSSATVIVRSSPRVVAPDWRNRIRRAPVIVALRPSPAFGLPLCSSDWLVVPSSGRKP